MFGRFLFFVNLIHYAQAEYRCICNRDATRPVFTNADNTSTVIGYLATNGCRQFAYTMDNTWNAIVFMHQIGFIVSNTSMIQTCFTDPVDTFTTDTTKQPTSATISSTRTTHRATTKTTHWPTTTHITTRRTTHRPTTMASAMFTTLSTATSSVPEGHIGLCPDHVKGDVNVLGGYLGQYGEHCLELVQAETQWHNAQRHCTDGGHGSLLEIHDPWKQDYVGRFLSNHPDVASIWLGLTDSVLEGAAAEGNWTWVTGKSVSYTHFGGDYNGHSSVTHKLNDCVIMKQGGEWTDVQCGVALQTGTGFGERHSFICQYNVTSKPPNIFHEQHGPPLVIIG